MTYFNYKFKFKGSITLDIENACDGKTHIHAARPKRKCNRPQVKIFTYSELVNILNDSTLNDIFQLQV
jgi:hypothetical protein